MDTFFNKTGEYRFIRRVGVELEGAWKGVHTLHNYSTTTGGVIIRDGSLDSFESGRLICTSDGKSADRDNLPEITVGEINSNPPCVPIRSVKTLIEFVRRYYPDYISNHCGMHVHMSTITRYAYNKLLCPEFTGDVGMGHKGEIFVALRKWAEKKGLPASHNIWRRLDNKNDFCRRSFLAEGQAKERSKNYRHSGAAARYTAVAYHWSRRGADSKPMRTVECRLLPMFENADLAVEAILEVMRTTNGFINKEIARREKSYDFNVPLSMGQSNFVISTSLRGGKNQCV